MNMNDALNAALKELTTGLDLRGEERRSKWIEENCPDEAFTIVEQTDNIRSTCLDLLVREDGVVWNEKFEEKLFKSLQEQFSWISAEGYSSLLAFAKYIAWHDGLNRRLSFWKKIWNWFISELKQT